MLDPELVGYLDQRFGALADLFARQSERTDQRFEQIEQRLDRMDLRFEQIEQRLDRMDLRFEQVELRLDRMDLRFEQIDRRFEQVDQSVREVHILFEDLDSRLRLVAEGVVFVSDALREFRVDVDRQFAEVKAVNRLSYVEIERRLATLGV